jgi:hypothetical protein
MKTTKVRVWTVTCPQCDVEMYSRAHHDYRVCGCPFQTMVDGGFAGYCHYGGMDIELLRKSFRYRFVSATRQELYNDWNMNQNKFGIIARKGSKLNAK